MHKICSICINLPYIINYGNETATKDLFSYRLCHFYAFFLLFMHK